MRNKRFILCLAALLYTGCAGTLQDYKPATTEESQIKEALITYESTYNGHNPEAFLALFHENAQIMTKDRVMVSKGEYARTVEDMFERFPSIACSKPYILVLDTKDKAVVEVFMDFESTQLASKISYIMENGRWRIWKIIYF